MKQPEPCTFVLPACGGWGGTSRRARSFGCAHSRCVAHGLDIVAVGIEHEGGVVVGVVVGAQARLAVVSAARLERGRIEGIDGGAVLAAKATCSGPLAGSPASIQKDGLPLWKSSDLPGTPKPTAARRRLFRRHLHDDAEPERGQRRR